MDIDKFNQLVNYLNSVNNDIDRKFVYDVIGETNIDLLLGEDKKSRLIRIQIQIDSLQQQKTELEAQ